MIAFDIGLNFTFDYIFTFDDIWHLITFDIFIPLSTLSPRAPVILNGLNTYRPPENGIENGADYSENDGQTAGADNSNSKKTGPNFWAKHTKRTRRCRIV